MKKILVTSWLKNNEEWYQPMNPVDLTEYDHVELLSLHHNGDLFYAWHNSTGKENGRLFRGRWNDGVK